MGMCAQHGNQSLIYSHILRQWSQILTTKVARCCSDWVQWCYSVDFGSNHDSLWFMLPFFDLQLVGQFPFDLLDISTGQSSKPLSINLEMVALTTNRLWNTLTSQFSMRMPKCTGLLSYIWLIHNSAITNLTFECCFFQTRERELKLLLWTDGMTVLKSLRLLDINSRAENIHWHSHHDPGDDILENTPPPPKKKSYPLLSPGTY